MNYLVLQSRVEDEINRTDLSTNIQTWVNEARSEIADGTLPILLAADKAQGAYRFHWTYKSSTLSISTTLNSWPSDFIEEISFFDVAAEKPLPKIMPERFDDLLYSETDDSYDLASTGTPKAYIPRGYQYEVFPNLTSARDFYLRYYAYPADLSGSTDEEEIDTQVPSLIIATSALKAARYLHDDTLKNNMKEQVVEYYMAARNKDRKGKFANRHLRMKTYSDYDNIHWKGKRGIR
jgi:hypothetical protein